MTIARAQKHDATRAPPPQVALRPPSVVMRLERMGSFFPTRLSFMRTLLRSVATEGGPVQKTAWEIDESGFGHAVYTLTLNGHPLSLVAFSSPLAPEQRTDRVIAEAWDTTYVLFDGIPSRDDIVRLADNVPKQEAGRFEASELVLCRANKSVRLFEHVVDCLSRGQQPDEALIGPVGYLMRTTAVYGNGKFGIADRDVVLDRPGLTGPFQAEMLTVWLIRGFTHDLAEHLARQRGGEQSVPLEPRLRRHLGIGNATGLGMAPFLVTHPILLNNWMVARETALARVRAIERADVASIKQVIGLVHRAQAHLQQWNVADERQQGRINKLRKELAEVAALVTKDWLSDDSPWDRLYEHSQPYSTECQELIVALLLEPHGALIDGLADCMVSASVPLLDSAMTVGELAALVDKHFAWALRYDFSNRRENAQFWYVSEDKLEPRIGRRYEEAGSERETPLDIARQAAHLSAQLATVLSEVSIAEFLMQCPECREIVCRVQLSEKCPYAEIQDNLIGESCLPIDMLRCKLSFFGASKFDPKSELWTRITLYQGAPLFDDMTGQFTDDWWLPVLEEV